MAPFNATKIFSNDNLCIFYVETLSDIDFISSLNENTYVFLQFTWNIEAVIDQFPWQIYEKKFGNGFDIKKNLIYCAPNESCYLQIISKGFSSVLLNHNALLDYNKFLFEINPDRKFLAVINSRPFWWKRVYLCKGIKGIAYIKGEDWAKDESSWTDWKSSDFDYLAEKIPPKKVSEIYQNSKMGLILSGNTGENTQKLNEGANYSTGEYLLSGLPVVTTPSQGGREYWLNSKNSITCTPSSDSLEISINLCLRNLNKGIFRRNQIRNGFIEKANYCRHLFYSKLDFILKRNSLSLSGKKLFEDIYFHKLTTYDVDKKLIIQIADKVRPN